MMGRKVTRNRIDIKPYPGKVQVQFEIPKVPMTSPTIRSKQASSSLHRSFHYNNNFNANATSTHSSSTTSNNSSMSLPKTQTLSSNSNRKSCSLGESTPISKCEIVTYQPSIQLSSKTAKSANLQGKKAIIADKLSSLIPISTCSGRQVLRPKQYED